MRTAVLFSTSLLFAAQITKADDVCTEATRQITEAARIYAENGTTAFWERILKNGPLDGDKRSLAQAQALTQIEQYFGSFQSSSILSKKALGDRSCYVVWVLEYANGPAFGVGTYYRTKKGVVTTSMSFKTDPEAILPSALLLQ